MQQPSIGFNDRLSSQLIQSTSFRVASALPSSPWTALVVRWPISCGLGPDVPRATPILRAFQRMQGPCTIERSAQLGQRALAYLYDGA